MKRITTYIYRNRSFEIITANPYEEGFRNAEQFDDMKDKTVCLAIEDKYITNGRLNTSLNLASMYSGNDMNDTISKVNQQVDIDYYMSEGMDWVSAYIKVNPQFKPIEQKLREIRGE